MDLSLASIRNMYSSAVVLVLVLGCSIGLSIAATTTTQKSKQTTRSSTAKPTTPKPVAGNKTTVDVNTAAKNGTKQTISLRQSFGSIEEPCQCVLFHLCESSNVVDGRNSDNQERCATDYVCCRMEPSSELAAASPVIESSSPPPPPPSPSQDSSCICVAFWRCIDYQVSPIPPVDEETNIESVINPRFPCEPPDFCCPPNSIIANNTLVSELSTMLPPTMPSAPPPTPPVDLPSQPVTEVRLPVSSEPTSSSASQVEPECGIKGTTVNSDPSESDIDSIININTKITNSEENAETVFGEFPWMVALFRSNDLSNTGELICGASLISPHIVLTAAHCVNNIDMSLLRVRAGEYNIGSDVNETYPHQERTINAVHIHPNFNAKRLYNDMALLSVNEPFHYESHVNSICAPLVNTPYAALNSYRPQNCWSTGWGKNSFTDANIQHKLKKVELPIVKREECQQKLRTTKLGKNFNLDGSFLCAGGQKGFDSCKGDGGGPLFCASRTNDKKFIQVGIVSWGVGCGNEIPGVYASLEANSEWLSTEINTMSVFRPY